MQPYPTAAEQPRTPRRSVPTSVANAIKAMYLGAVAEVAVAVVFVATSNATKLALRHTFPHYSTQQLMRVERGAVIAGVVVSLIGAALFIWIARSSRSAKNWSRVVAAVLFVLGAVGAAVGRTPEAAADRAMAVVVAVIGLMALVPLWTPSASAYFGRSGRESS